MMLFWPISRITVEKNQLTHEKDEKIFLVF
jgi:hypothetical protein